MMVAKQEEVLLGRRRGGDAGAGVEFEEQEEAEAEASGH